MGHAPAAFLVYGIQLEFDTNQLPGFTDGDKRDQIEASLKEMRLELVKIGSDAEDEWMIAAVSYKADWDGTKAIPSFAVVPSADDRLYTALEQFGLTATSGPGWRLAAYLPG